MTDTDLRAPTLRPHPVRRALTAIGATGLALAVASALILAYAALNGVHCAGCQRLELGDSAPAWERALDLRIALALIALPLSLLGAFGSRRIFGLAGFLLALLLAGYLPR